MTTEPTNKELYEAARSLGLHRYPRANRPMTKTRMVIRFRLRGYVGSKIAKKVGINVNMVRVYLSRYGRSLSAGTYWISEAKASELKLSPRLLTTWGCKSSHGGWFAAPKK